MASLSVPGLKYTTIDWPKRSRTKDYHKWFAGVYADQNNTTIVWLKCSRTIGYHRWLTEAYEDLIILLLSGRSVAGLKDTING